MARKPTWREVGTETGNTRIAAQWALDLHAGGDLSLSDLAVNSTDHALRRNTAHYWVRLLSATYP